MSVVTPISATGKMLAYTRQLVADSLYWQALVMNPEATAEELQEIVDDTPEVLDRDAALDAISVRVWPVESTLATPRCLIRKLTDTKHTRETSSTFNSESMVMILFELPVPYQWRNREQDSLTNQGIDAEDKIGMILSEMKTVITSGVAQRPQIEEFTFGPQGLVYPDEETGETGWLETCEIIGKIEGYC